MRSSRTIRVPRSGGGAGGRSPFFHLHAHSLYSSNDAISSVEELVATASGHGQPALAITDHGNMSASVALYQQAKAYGLAPLPGQEFYLKRDATDKKAKRYHLGLVATTTQGYESLCWLSSQANYRDKDNADDPRNRFHHKPHIDFSDLAEFAERGWTNGLTLTTGCYFGMVTQTLVTEGFDAARRLVATFAKWVPETLVEVQHHNIQHESFTDTDIVDQLTMIADDLGLGLVATQDAHYAHESDKSEHETLKRLVSFSDDPDDAVFPGDSFHLAAEDWVAAHYTEKVWRRALEGLAHVLEGAQVTIPELEEYHYKIPVVTDEPEDRLRHLCGVVTNSWAPRYRERIDQELAVIEATGMAGYLLLVKEVTDWCRNHDVFFQTRGSASGSLVCYVMGITQLDPLKWGLRYERFISPDRTKPPDVDLDVEDDKRGGLIEWLRQRFTVCHIGTHASYSLHTTGASSGGGSLFISALSKKRKQGQDVSGIDSIYDLDAQERTDLLALSSRDVKKGSGVHAAGMVVTSAAGELSRRIPTMLVASSETTVTQYEMDDVEDLGFVKLDVLGLRSLRLLRRVCSMTDHDHDDLAFIDLADSPTFRMIRTGDTDGVFQLEGWAARKGAQELKCRSVSDIVAVMALYRPATMDNGAKDAYVRRKAGWESVPARTKILEKALKSTYGIPVFQEQVVEILRELGFDAGDLTKFLKAIKASNAHVGKAGETIAAYHDQFTRLADQAGWSEDDEKFAWQAIEAFAAYSFNKAHASMYALTAYRLAYMKRHYPLEFAGALLETWAGSQKEKQYLRTVREMGISILKASVNVSGATWTVDYRRQALRRGLLSIDGVGTRAAEEIVAHQPFTDVGDMVNRCAPRAVSGGKDYHKHGTLSGVMGKLSDAGALKEIQ